VTDEVVLVEVWDVVDKGIPKKGIVRAPSGGGPAVAGGAATNAPPGGPKIGGPRSPEVQPKSIAPAKGAPPAPAAAKKGEQKAPEVGSEYEIPVVDATFVDVYKGIKHLCINNHLVIPRSQGWLL
jgi:hypothetical protein